MRLLLGLLIGGSIGFYQGYESGKEYYIRNYIENGYNGTRMEYQNKKKESTEQYPSQIKPNHDPTHIPSSYSSKELIYNPNAHNNDKFSKIFIYKNKQ